MPEWGPEIRARLTNVRLSPQREIEIVEELSLHLDDRFRDFVAGGASPDEALRMARLAFNEQNLLAPYLSPLRQAQWMDPAPSVPSRPWSLEGLGADLRQAVRGMRAAPSFTVGALVVLALGIGATTSIFSVVDAVVLRGLPFDGADRIVAVGERLDARAVGKSAGLPLGMPGAKATDADALARIEPQNYLDWVARQKVFSSIAALADLNEFTLDLPGAEPEAIVGHRTTASFFDVLRARPALGRLFTADDEVEGRDRVVVLSDTFWRHHFGGDPGIVGRTMAINGGTFEVVAVMPAGFNYPVGAMSPAALWVPYVMTPNERVRGRGRSIYLQSIARLEDGVTLAQAQAQMDQVATAVAADHPATNTGRGIGVRSLRDHLVGANTQSWLAMLLVAVGLVLLIACTNVANLWLARASARERDIAIRAALGAGRWRLVRLLLVESLVVSIAGTVLGLGMAWPCIRVLKAAMPEGVARVANIGVDLRVIAVAAALALATGVLSGIVPALQASRTGALTVLNESARGGGMGRGRRRLRSALVVVEVAFAVVLLVGAGLFIGSFVNVMRVDLGFRSDDVLTVQIYPGRPQGGEPAPDIRSGLDDIIGRLRHAPGVVDVAAAAPGIPLRVNMWIDALGVPGRAVDGDSSVSVKTVTPSYHRALAVPLRSGRFFGDGDDAGGQKVIILSEAAARAFFGEGDAVGQTVAFRRVERTVIGVVANVKQSSLEVNPHPEIYLPLAQSPPTQSAYLLLRTSGEPHAALPAVRAAVSSVLPRVPIRYVSTMDELIAGQTAERRLNMLMLGLFGALGLVISAVGVFGVMAYLVGQRTREIGVRMALGATRSTILAMVLRHALGLVVAGLGLGGIAAWYLAIAARRFLFGLESHDVRAFAVSAVTLLLAAIVATLLPARRAASISPTVAIRSE